MSKTLKDGNTKKMVKKITINKKDNVKNKK